MRPFLQMKETPILSKILSQRIVVVALVLGTALLSCVPVDSPPRLGNRGSSQPGSFGSAVLAPSSSGVAPTVAPAQELPTGLAPANAVPAISAKAAIVIDGTTGRVLAAKNPDERRAVASTQKILTALLTLESGPLSDPVTVIDADTRVEPSKIYIRDGETYTRGALVKALMVKSGNDVAKALARDIAGSESAFVSRMNSRARALGMTQSNFRNPHGLTEEDQYSTARDIAILARAAYQLPVFRSFVKTKSYTFTRPSGQTKTLTNTNQLLGRVPYCTGVKTGTTRASGRCLVSAGELNGRFTVVVVLGADNQTKLYDDSEALLRWSLER